MLVLCALEYEVFIDYPLVFDNFHVLQLKQRLQLLTLGIGGVGVISAYISYSPEIAVRYEFLFSCHLLM